MVPTKAPDECANLAFVVIGYLVTFVPILQLDVAIDRAEKCGVGTSALKWKGQ